MCVFPGLELTSDDGRDLVPANSDAVGDLADEGRVDRVVHLQHLELVFVPQHRVWENPRHPAEGRQQRGVITKTERGTNNNEKKGVTKTTGRQKQREHRSAQGHHNSLIMTDAAKPISLAAPHNRRSFISLSISEKKNHEWLCIGLKSLHYF